MGEQINIYPTPTCILQERAYTTGWRNYGDGVRETIITGGYAAAFRKSYARGWTDHQKRERCAAMYAAERTVNERTQR